MDSIKRQWLIIIGLVVLLVGASSWSYWHKTAEAPQLSSVAPAPQLPAGAEGAQVTVSGAVARPGLYKVGAGSRVGDVISAAGGLATGADAGRVNLAQPVRDGQHIQVPFAAGPPAAPQPPAGKVNINSAGKDELDSLPGVGPVLAERIIEYRKAHGQFRDIGELKRVPGIGEAKFNQMKDRLTI